MYRFSKRVGGIFDEEDRLQTAALGACVAMTKHNPEKGSFVQCAKAWILDECHKTTKLYAIRRSCKAASMYGFKVSRFYYKNLNRGIVVDAATASKELNIPLDKVEIVMEMLQENHISAALQLHFSEELVEFSADEQMENDQRAKKLKEVIAAFRLQLPDARSKEIFDCRILNAAEFDSANHPNSEMPTLLQLAEKYNVSRERIRQIEDKIRRDLKEFLTENFNPEEY